MFPHPQRVVVMNSIVRCKCRDLCSPRSPLVVAVLRSDELHAKSHLRTARPRRRVPAGRSPLVEEDLEESNGGDDGTEGGAREGNGLAGASSGDGLVGRGGLGSVGAAEHVSNRGQAGEGIQWRCREDSPVVAFDVRLGVDGVGDGDRALKGDVAGLGFLLARLLARGTRREYSRW